VALNELRAAGPNEGSAYFDFLMILAVCHTVVIETAEDGTRSYQVRHTALCWGVGGA
jgi:hypothetical protein